MARSFNDSDENKPVVSSDGDQIGTVDRVSGNRLHVRPTSGLSNQMRQRLGWEDEDEETYPIRHSQVDNINDAEIKLKSNL